MVVGIVVVLTACYILQKEIGRAREARDCIHVRDRGSDVQA